MLILLSPVNVVVIPSRVEGRLWGVAGLNVEGRGLVVAGLWVNVEGRVLAVAGLWLNVLEGSGCGSVVEGGGVGVVECGEEGVGGCRSVANSGGEGVRAVAESGGEGVGGDTECGGMVGTARGSGDEGEDVSVGLWGGIV